VPWKLQKVGHVCCSVCLSGETPQAFTFHVMGSAFGFFPKSLRVIQQPFVERGGLLETTSLYHGAAPLSE
jgi:hypothetical protein